MLKAARHEALLQWIETRGYVTIEEIAEHLDVSAATVRRDVAQLAQQQLLERTWGGVRSCPERDDPFHDALGRTGAGKQAIGLAAAKLVRPGATVIFDVGTTVHHLALALPHYDITAITASLPAFDVLRCAEASEVIVLGGRFLTQYQCFDGQSVVDVLGGIHADLAFLGCSGVSDSGQVRDNSSTQSAIKRAIRRAADQVVLLADHTKFPGKGNNVPLSVGELDAVITDATTLTPRLVELCQAQNTEIHYV